MDTHPAPSEDRLRAFLLGRLPADARDDLERRLFEDDALHETLDALEDDLIREHLDGELDAEDDARFARRLRANRRGRLRLELHRHLDREARRRFGFRGQLHAFFEWLRSAPKLPAFALQAALVALVALPLLWQIERLDERNESLRAEVDATRSDSITGASEGTATTPGRLRPVELAFDLPPTVRSVGGSRLPLTPGVERLRLRVPLPPGTTDSDELRATLSVGGETTWSSDEVTILVDALGARAEVVVEATTLGDGSLGTRPLVLSIERLGPEGYVPVDRFPFTAVHESLDPIEP